jgi:type I restriction enzyme M protein
LSLSNEELSKYWDAANTLREDLDAAEYKHIVLGLVFLKFISDAFTERRSELEKQFADPKSDTYKKDERARKIALDERDYYLMANVFWVPEKARWEILQQNSKQPNIAKQIDDALFAIEKDNPKLEGIVERSYAASKLPVDKLGQVVDLIGQISFDGGRREASDILGQVYEYFLGKFANAEGKLGGQFYTTPSIVKTIVEVLKPTKGRVYDPACGSGGMFVQSEKFAEAHGGRLGDISIYGQESNPTTRRLCAMNLAIRGIEFNLGKTAVSTFKDDQHKDLKFDYIMMNPPFGKNASYPKKDLLDDVRWKKYGIPREKPANYAWLSHAIHHLAPKGRAGIVMPRGAVTSDQDTDGKIRSAFLDDDIIECIIDLPGQLFFNVQIPATLWFFNKDKSKWKNDRNNQILMIDARKMGSPISSTQIEFSTEEIERIGNTFEAWANGKYEDVDWYCKSVSRDDVKKKGDVLSPGRYIGTEALLGDEPLPLKDTLPALTTTINEQLATSASLGQQIQEVLRKLSNGL